MDLIKKYNMLCLKLKLVIKVPTLGPMVTATASARISTPLSMAMRASAPNLVCVLMSRVKCIQLMLLL